MASKAPEMIGRNGYVILEKLTESIASVAGDNVDLKVS